MHYSSFFVFLVLFGVVVALLALVAPQSDLHSVAGLCHTSAPPYSLARSNKKAGAGLFAVSSRKRPTGAFLGGVEPALIASL